MNLLDWNSNGSILTWDRNTPGCGYQPHWQAFVSHSPIGDEKNVTGGCLGNTHLQSEMRQLDDGNFRMVYQNSSKPVRLLEIDGSSVEVSGSSQAINGPPPNFQKDSYIIPLSDGFLILLSADGDIYSQKFDFANQPIGQAQLVNAEAADPFPLINFLHARGIDLPNGNVLTRWVEFNSTVSTRITAYRVRHVNSTGAPVGGVEQTILEGDFGGHNFVGSIMDFIRNPEDGIDLLMNVNGQLKLQSFTSTGELDGSVQDLGISGVVNFAAAKVDEGIQICYYHETRSFLNYSSINIRQQKLPELRVQVAVLVPWQVRLRPTCRVARRLFLQPRYQAQRM